MYVFSPTVIVSRRIASLHEATSSADKTFMALPSAMSTPSDALASFPTLYNIVRRAKPFSPVTENATCCPHIFMNVPAEARPAGLPT